MKVIRAGQPKDFFHVVAETPRSQAATMVLKPGETTGGDDNVHPKSDQWLYVISGRGKATVGNREIDLETGALLLVEAGETHEIRNSGTEALVTVNVYAPPAY
jgi:mannose-6-phosphate isomerase-like protein (cupin superfamily)